MWRIVLIVLVTPAAFAWLPQTRQGSRILVPLQLATPSDSGLIDKVDEIEQVGVGLEGENVFEHAFGSLLGEDSAEKFAALLKLWASKRAILTRGEKQSLIEASLKHMDALEADQLSSCVWSLGVIGYKFNPSSLPSKSQSHDGKKKKNKMMISGGSQHHLTLSQPLSNQLIQHSIRALTEVGHTEVLCRILSSLARMGCDWSSLPGGIKAAVVDTLTEEEPRGEPSRGDEPSSGSGKDISILCYILGQLQAKASDLPPRAVVGLLTRLNSALEGRAMTPQGIVNSLNGLQRLGLRWTDDLAVIVPPLCESVLGASTDAVGAMRKDEVCSLLHSFASLKVSWSESLPIPLQQAIVQSIQAHAPSFNNREIANAYWALGKLHYPYSSTEDVSMEEVLSESLARKADTFNQFDVESTFVGLGLMEASFESLPQQARSELLSKVDEQLESMNIFKLYNVLWGMARVGLTVDSPELSEQTSSRLLDKTVDVFHTFIKRQYGDVMWALGSMGYSFGGEELNVSGSGKGELSNAAKTRMLAILTRVFTKLETREAAYVLWGLAKMGVRWQEDMCEETRSLERGEAVSPMAKTVSLYLKRQQFREHDYAVLLYSLGALGVRFHESLSTGIVSKLNKVAPFVSPHFSSRSLCSCLDGLATCGTVWADISGGDVVKVAYIEAMQATDSNKGITGMNALEITKTLHSLAAMGVSWNVDLPEGVRAVVREVLERESNHFTSYNVGVVRESLERLQAPSYL